MRAKKEAKAIVIGSGLLKGKYPRCTTDLKSADNDAQAMAAFAASRGFVLVGPGGTQTPFLSAEAKKDDIMGAVAKAATDLEEGDTLLFFYSGHGASLAVTDSSSFRQQRETWTLLDGRLWDFEWDHLMGEFKSGVKIVLVSDSCYSGGFGPPEERDPREPHTPECSITKVLRGDCFKDYATDSVKEFARLRAGYPPKKRPLRARALLLAACQANQLACAEAEYGHFTHALLEVVETPGLSYKQFYSQVKKRFGPPTQSPFWWVSGPGSDAFLEEEAFRP